MIQVCKTDVLDRSPHLPIIIRCLLVERPGRVSDEADIYRVSVPNTKPYSLHAVIQVYHPNVCVTKCPI